MAYFRNPMFAAEPFEESQGDDAKVVSTSPDDLKTFYENMEKKERQDMLERKASRRKSTHKLFSRKSSLKQSSATVPAPPGPERPGPQPPLSTTTTTLAASEKPQGSTQDANEMENLEQNERNDSVTNLPASRSIIPDTLKELPAWYNKDDWSSSTSYRSRFPVHNPVGPRYYRNHHLIPPSMYRPGARPPSVFSPSFPAMGTTSMPEQAPGPSRTPSHSPLPTPSSSQTRVADLGIKPRSRKTSQTAHDTVDLLDLSDPWGTNWHHESPYDIGLGNTSPVAADSDPSRSRRSSMTTQARRKTVTPSPLSQSTSAIHLQPPSADGAHIPRKLSKRRGLSGIFGSHSKNQQPAAVSLPATPLSDHPYHAPQSLRDTNKRASTMPPGPPPTNKSVSAIKKERRGSILGRLSKRFSVSRKPNVNASVAIDGLPHTDDRPAERALGRQASPEKLQKRVPPPSVNDVEEITLKAAQDIDRRSSISYEGPFVTTGKLTVANPDAPSSEISTPPQVNVPLPVQKTDSPDRQPGRSEESQPFNFISSHRIPSPPVPHLPPVQAQSHSPNPNTSQRSIEKAPLSSSVSSPPLNGHVSVGSDSMVTSKRASRNGTGAGAASSLSNKSSQRHSLDDKPLPKPSERVSSPPPSSSRRSMDQRPSDPAPPPPSSTTKPIPLPHVSAAPSASTQPIPAPEAFAPPPPSATTKSIPLPGLFAPPPPSATTKPIPLPTSTSAHRTEPVSHTLPLLAEGVVGDSPLSTASMIANPPTPHTVNDTLAPSTSAPSAPRRTSSREPSPGISSVTTRETETFKLVRSKSGNVVTSSETIPAAGEQWEVVGGEPSHRRGNKVRDQDNSSSSRSDREAESRERESRRESRRQEKKPEVEVEVGDRRSKRSSRHRQRSVGDAPEPSTSYSNKPIGRSSSLESHHRSPIPDYMRQQDDARSGRTRDGERKRHGRKAESASPTKPGPLERHPSTSVRPTSEVPPAADLNALRAREAWEMERLYKGRSMYGLDQNGDAAAPPPAVPAPSSTTSPASHGSTGATVSKQGSIHGSSHTSFVVQNFSNQSATPQIYHSMPAVPPPILYSSTSLPGQNATASVSPPASFSSPDIFPIRSPNPLPEPPRETTHELPRLSQTFSDSTKNGRPTEYWTQYAEVTTAH